MPESTIEIHLNFDNLDGTRTFQNKNPISLFYFIGSNFKFLEIHNTRFLELIAF